MASPSPVRAVCSSLGSIGASIATLGKSGLLGPYTPAQLARLGTLAASTPVGLGSVYDIGAALSPDTAAVVDEAGAVAFEDMAAQAARLAGGLAGCGIGEGSTVAVLCRNHRGFLLAMVALARLGSDVVYLNTGFAGPQLAEVVAAEGVEALILDEELVALAAHVAPTVPRVLAWGDDGLAAAGCFPPAGPGAGSVPPAGPGAGSVPPAGPGAGSVPPAGPGAGSVPPAGPGAGSVPPAGSGAGSVPPAGSGAGSVPPAGSGAGSVPPAGSGAGSVPPAGSAPTARMGDLVAQGQPRPSTARPGRQVLLTSGTTGRPKGAARGAPRNPAVVVGLLSRIPYRRSDVTVLAAPAFHAWGFANAALGLALGSTLVLQRRFDAAETLRAVASYRARVLVAVPVMLQRILELPAAEVRALDLSSLEVVAVSGSALPGGLVERAQQALGDVVYSLYGSTEAGWVSVATPADLRRAPNSAGRLLPGVSLRLLDADGRPVPEGASGRIAVRSSLTFGGYTDGGGKEALEGYLLTGDVGRREAGLLFVEGRDDEMIVSGGENVFPTEVEDLLARHPAVGDVAVVGVADEQFGQRLEAWVVRRPGAAVDEAELTDLVRAELARFKVPRAVHFVDALPRNTTGKVLRRQLVAPGTGAGPLRPVPGGGPRRPSVRRPGARGRAGAAPPSEA